MDEFDKHSSGLFASEQSVRKYSMIERSWAEQRGYLDQAIACLDKDKQAEVKEAFGRLEPTRKDCSADAEQVSVQEVYAVEGYKLTFGVNGSLVHLSDANEKVWVDESHPFGVYAYETFGTEDYARYFRTYMQNLSFTHPWSDADFNKPGFEFVRPLPSHQLYEPIVTDMMRVNGKRFLLRLRMPVQAYELYGAPKELELVYDFEHEGTVDVSLQWFGKRSEPPSRSKLVRLCIECR